MKCFANEACCTLPTLPAVLEHHYCRDNISISVLKQVVSSQSEPRIISNNISISVMASSQSEPWIFQIILQECVALTANLYVKQTFFAFCDVISLYLINHLKEF